MSNKRLSKSEALKRYNARPASQASSSFDAWLVTNMILLDSGSGSADFGRPSNCSSSYSSSSYSSDCSSSSSSSFD